MITAIEAKTLAQKHDNEINLGKVDSYVVQASRNGRNSVTIDLTQYPYLKENSAAVIKKLKSLGYVVSQDNGYDPRDGVSWNSLSISWE